MQTTGKNRRVGTGLAMLALGAVALPLWAAGVAQAQGMVTISDIQGARHLSPYVGREVTTIGVVTAVAFGGYYVQDPVGDGDDTTSDGMFVVKFGSKPNVGDRVQLTDVVEEVVPGDRPGQPPTFNLTTTQMNDPDLILLSPGNALPTPVIIGSGGRIPPNVDVISTDELPVDLQSDPGAFDPENDGIDFFESLEGMLVTVEQPVAISGTRRFGRFSSEVFTLPSDGAHVAPSDARNARGGIDLQPDPDNLGDQNPERVQIQFDGTLFPFPVPAITVGDLLGDVTGVVGYSFGNFEVNAIAPFDVLPSGLGAETTLLSGSRRSFTVASYNVLNLDPLSGDDAQRATLASHIAVNLGSPDVIALQEIQDNNGTTPDDDPENPTLDATQTLQALVDAIFEAGGPRYAFFDAPPPVNDAFGGAPGSNIRNAFLYNPDWIELVEFRSLTPAELTLAGADPDAFAGTRYPLLGVFKFGRREFTVINNHLSSRFGSTPIFGGPQPFVQAGEDERGAQTQALNDYVDFLLKRNPRREIMVVGDLNTFQFANELTDTLPGKGRVLRNLIDRLDDDEVYTFNFEGNSQVLDHFFVSRSLRRQAVLDIVHVNVDFPRVDNTVGSDHEPLLALIGPRDDDDDDDDDDDNDDDDEGDDDDDN